jgi:hypothetical protein
MARALTADGVGEESAYELARLTESDLAQRGEVSVDLDRLRELAVEVLGEERGSRAVRQLRRFRDLQELDLPVILLVGGGRAPASRPWPPGRVPARHHACDLDRLRAADDACVFAKEFMPSIHY